MARGRFITIEGGEGAGKSTQIGRLGAALRRHGPEVVETREPGGAPGALEIRKLLVEGATDRWDAVSELLLHSAARRDHIIRTIEQNFKYFGHFHTAGNPGRHELSIDQEINYKAICKKILELGYTGYISHEYTPVVKPVREALLEAIEQCTVV